MQVYLIIECVKRLRKWVDLDNELKVHVAGIQQKCADFEYKLIPKIKEVGNAYVTIAQNEYQVASGYFSDLKGKSILSLRSFQLSAIMSLKVSIGNTFILQKCPSGVAQCNSMPQDSITLTRTIP